MAVPSSAPSLPYSPALDGLRAFCVVAVILYHGDVGWMPGGFLGVEVFFVLSGFLITSLLQSEFASSARVDLLQFWRRRARRLLPALWALLLAVSVYAAFRLPAELWRLRAEAAAAFAYVANWYFTFAHYSYFETTGRPSLLAHLWSLAIEEQFYLLWPVLFYLGARRLTRRTIGALCIALALLSSAWMAIRFVPGIDPSPLYYDSAARAAAILSGAALATLVGAAVGAVPALVADLLGWAGMLGLIASCVCVSEAEPLVFRGGLLAVDLCAIGVIVAAVHPTAGTLQRVLSIEPLRLVGTRSYGLYLWHWPVAALTRPGLDVPFGVSAAFALRLTLTVVLAELSYRFVELPVRRRGFIAPAHMRWRQLRLGSAPRLRRVALAALLSLPIVCFAIVAQAFVLATRPATSPAFDSSAPALAPSDVEDRRLANVSLPIEQVDDPRKPFAVEDRDVQHAPRVLLVGDSVMLGAWRYLRAGHEDDVEIDAEIGRTATTTLSRLRKLRQAGKLRPVMIVHLGDNGWLFDAQVHEMMELFDGVRRVVFVNAHVPRRWQDRNNGILSAALAQHPSVILVDWAKASENHREYFGVDGLHLTHAGAQALANLIVPYYLLAPRD
jgi:peptidoglycan/LPS O-acetylase OafA/YrhL